MIKKILFPLLLTIANLSAGPSTLNRSLPPEFYVNQRFFSWTNTFDIETREYKLGTVHRKLFSWTLEYDFYNFHDEFQAKARHRFFSFGAVFDFYDAQERSLGIVEERIFTFFPAFTILSPGGQILADASLNFWGTTYTVTSPQSNQPIATLSRSFFRLKDDWTVHILNPDIFHENGIDPRLFITLMAFQTDLDEWRARQQAEDWKEYFDKSIPERILEESFERKSFLSQVDDLKSQLKDISVDSLEEEPSSEDILFVENLTASVQSTEFVSTFNQLLEKFKDDSLTEKQKCVLYNMMEERLNRFE